MAKPVKRSVQQPRIVSSAEVKATQSKDYSKYFVYILAVIAFALYFNSVFNKYALDDSVVINQNTFTKKGFSGIKDLLGNDTFLGYLNSNSNFLVGGRYRPLSVVTLAVEYQFFGENPHISHFVNVLLFTLLIVLLYKVLQKMFAARGISPKNGKWFLNLPFLITLLFAIHPIHTEVVANIKGRDELMAFLGAFGAMWFSMKYVENQKWWLLPLSFVCAFLGMMSKENALTFVVIVPLTIWFFIQTDWKKNVLASLPVLLAAGVFLAIRFKILGAPNPNTIPNLLNDPFLEATVIQRFATIIYTWLIYIKLLFVPYNLTVDYYPYHIPLVSFSNPWVILSILVNLGLGIFALIKMKSKSLVSYAILFYFITFSIVSNLFFTIGAFMGERFVFFSSLGFCIVISYLLIKSVDKYKVPLSVLRGILLVIIILFSARTFSRNMDWKDDFTLFTTDVKVSKNSTFSTKSAGNHLIEEANKPENADKRQEYLKLAVEYLTKSVEVYPRHQKALWLLGNAHYLYNKNIGQALYYYGQLLQINPEYSEVFQNIPVMMDGIKDSIDFKIRVWSDLNNINPKRWESNYFLGLLLRENKKDYKAAIPYLEKCMQLKPDDANSYLDLGVCYGNLGDMKKALELHLEGYKRDSSIHKLVTNLSIIYKALGNKQKAGEFAEKANKLKD
jgi:protein O-mannosyl-transferase